VKSLFSSEIKACFETAQIDRVCDAFDVHIRKFCPVVARVLTRAREPTDITAAMVSLPWLRILAFQTTRGVWVARALEHDIAAEGRSSEAAVSGVLRIVFAHIDHDRRHGRAPLSAFPPAPDRVRSASRSATPIRMMRSASSALGGADECQIAIAIIHDRQLVPPRRPPRPPRVTAGT
jgi:hypothetical protein